MHAHNTPHIHRTDMHTWHLIIFSAVCWVHVFLHPTQQAMSQQGEV